MSQIKLTEADKSNLLLLVQIGDADIEDARLTKQVRKNLVSALSLQLLAFAEGDEDVDREGSEPSEELKLLTHILATSFVVGYWQGFNNDISADVSDEFGFAELEDCMNSVIAPCLGEIVPAGKAGRMLEIGLHVNMRSCSATEYFNSQEFWRKDISTLVKLLSSDVNDDYNIDMLKAIEECDSFTGTVNNYVASTLALYKLLFADAYGVSSYEGVMSKNGVFITLDRRSMSLRNVAKAKHDLSELADRVYKQIDKSIEISESRQFNYAEIFRFENKVVYFPKKIIEYAFCRQSELNVKIDVYRPYAEKGLSWDDYSAQYVAGNVRAVLQRGIYAALEHELKVSFKDEKFVVSIQSCPDYLDKALEKPGLLKRCKALVYKVFESLNCAFILTKFPYINNTVAAINLRMCIPNDIGELNSSAGATKYLFAGLISKNKNQEFTPPVNITAGRVDAQGVNAANVIYEYQYDVNPALSEAEPLFGYTVQRVNQIKGIQAGWGNILLGRDISGKDLYSGSGGDIFLQGSFIHNIFAGSRAGKGVMTMNLLANALAAGKPIFYLDRKPDMASMFYYMSGGEQFIINGDNYNEGDDNFLGVYNFNEANGAALEPWRLIGKPYLEKHPEYAEVFGLTPSNVAYFGTYLADYVYLRAFMFCLGILVIRSKFSGFKDKYLGGGTGIVVVLDEFNGAQSGISAMISGSGAISKKAALLGSLDAIREKKEEIEVKIAKAELKRKDNNSNGKTVDFEVAQLRKEVDKLNNPTAAYAATVLSKLAESYVLAVSQATAGLKQNEFLPSDIFVLGQNLDTAPFRESQSTIAGRKTLHRFTRDGMVYANSDNGDLIRAILDVMESQDWFFGGNTSKKFAATLSGEKIVEKWVEDKNNPKWAYLASPSVVKYDDIMLDLRPKYAGKFVLFKPYLVLNMHYEGNPPYFSAAQQKSGKSYAGTKYTYVAQCSSRVDRIEGLWDSVRRQHLLDPADTSYDTLDPGIGFEGLIKDTMRTTEECRGMSDEELSAIIKSALGKSGKAADAVAEAMGYKNGWKSLIFDFSPDGLFSIQDMVDAVADPVKYASNRAGRLPIFAELGLLQEDKAGDGNENGDGSGYLDVLSMLDRVGVDESTVQENPVNVDSSVDFSDSSSVETAPNSFSDMGRSASEQFFGDQHVDESESDEYADVYSDDSDEEAQSYNPYGQSAMDEHEILLFARNVVEVAVVASGKQFSDDEINELIEFVFQMTIELMEEG